MLGTGQATALLSSSLKDVGSTAMRELPWLGSAEGRVASNGLL
jgi:hypothetical protein